MSESFPGLRGMPLYGLCSELCDGVFPRARVRIVRVLVAYGRVHPGGRRNMRLPENLLRKLEGIRSDRQLERYLAERCGLKDLVSLYWWSIHFLRNLAEFHVDSLGFQECRRLLGKRPTRLRFVRSALRFWRSQHS